MNHTPLYTNNVTLTLQQVLETLNVDKFFILTDENTQQLCYPILNKTPILQGAKHIVVKPNDEHKTIESLSFIWKSLEDGGATRHSCLINLGGGMVTDMGGFAAGTFKRGIKFVNIPTTLLAMIDASLGGKTGINFYSLKNNIGLFVHPQAVVIDKCFLTTLTPHDLRSGYAEMIKHSLLSNEKIWAETLSFPLCNGAETLSLDMIRDNVNVKESIVTQDPYERGLRKALNLGHTMGHAFETLMMRHNTPIAHGYAVAWGLLGELYLSVVHKGFPSYVLQQTSRFINDYYGQINISCNHYDELIELMKHDKKNKGNAICFTLLKNIGEVALDCVFKEEDLKMALDFVREG